MESASSAASAATPGKRNLLGEFTRGKLAMWLFLGSDAMGFMGLIGAYMVLRISSGNWIVDGRDPELGITLTAIMTFILILSSVTMVTAHSKITKGDQAGLVKWLGLTILGGVVFLGLQVYEWWHLIDIGLAAHKGNYAATFFAMTGFHGAHVLVGVIYLFCIWWRARQGAYTATNNSPVELVGLYWHFVDLVWIVLFTIVYLIPDSVVG